jgi:HK97 family phage portal protein
MVKFSDRVKAFIKPNIREVGSARTGSLASFSGMSDSGITVTEESALKFSAVWQAMRILSELPASLPIEFYEEKGTNRTPVEHKAKELLMQPNPLMNRFTWAELMNSWLQGWGNGIAIIEPTKLIPVHPSGVKPKIVNGELFYEVDDKDLDIHKTFFSEEIIHYRGFTTTGYWGRSPIQSAKDNIGLGLAAEKYGARFFKKGGNLKAVIESEGHMNDAEFKEWKKRWDTNYTGDAGDHSTPILEYGLKYKNNTIAPDAAQFLQTRQFSIQDVARWFNLPPHMVGDLSRSTFSNIEHQDIQFVKYTLRPIVRRQEIELEEKLLAPKEKGRIRIRFNLDGLLRGDLASVTQHIKEMVLAGVMSPDEGRGLLNRNPRPGGDEFYTPANIVGNTNTQNDANK